MQLSDKALSELKDILETEIDKEAVQEMTNEGVNKFGVFLLTIAANGLSIRIREKTTSPDEANE